MKLLFLDVDGVLNSTEFFLRRQSPPAVASDQIDARAVTCLEIILRLTNCNVVLSSMWRHKVILNDFVNALGMPEVFRERFIGVTPLAAYLTSPSGLITRCESRHQEISAWLTRVPCERYCILDDQSDFGPLQSRLVQTDPRYGLREAEAERVIAMLGRTER